MFGFYNSKKQQESIDTAIKFRAELDKYSITYAWTECYTNGYSCYIQVDGFDEFRISDHEKGNFFNRHRYNLVSMSSIDKHIATICFFLGKEGFESYDEFIPDGQVTIKKDEFQSFQSTRIGSTIESEFTSKKGTEMIVVNATKKITQYRYNG